MVRRRGQPFSYDFDSIAFSRTPISFTLDQERFANLLNLFGCVNAELTSHKLRGLNIVIRLAKTLKGISWPRLVQTKEKNRSIEYNFEALNEFGE